MIETPYIHHMTGSYEANESSSEQQHVHNHKDIVHRSVPSSVLKLNQLLLF